MARILAIGGISLGILGLFLLVRKAKAGPEPEPDTGDERIVITQISASQDAEGITATIKWKHNISAVVRDAAFVEAQISIGRMENGIWTNYYTVGAQGNVPIENQIASITAFWGQGATPAGLAGFKCQITAFNEGWQEIAKSPWYVAENIIEVE